MNETRPNIRTDGQGFTIETTIGTPLAARLDIAIQQGATKSLLLTWVDNTKAPVDLSAYTARLKIRPTWGSSTTHSSLTESSGITLASGSPNITIAWTATQTAALTGWLRGVYDLELVSGATVTRLIEGFVTLRSEVTT